MTINITATELATTLSKNIMKIEFEKLDGAIRQMIATRNLEVIPTENHPKGSNEVYNEITDETPAVKVFDMQVCGWRSIRPASVKSMEVFGG